MVTFVRTGDQVMVIFLGQMEHTMKENLFIICDMEKVCLVISTIYCSFFVTFFLFFYFVKTHIFFKSLYCSCFCDILNTYQVNFLKVIVRGQRKNHVDVCHCCRLFSDI